MNMVGIDLVWKWPAIRASLLGGLAAAPACARQAGYLGDQES